MELAGFSGKIDNNGWVYDMSAVFKPITLSSSVGYYFFSFMTNSVPSVVK